VRRRSPTALRLAPLVAIVLAPLLALAGCGAPVPAPSALPSALPSDEPAAPVRYVVLGDSYSAGTGLDRVADRWPNQLARALRRDVDLEVVANLAASGATTYEVIDRQLPLAADLEPGFVSLLVGANDVIRDVSPEDYRANRERILDGPAAAGGDGPPEDAAPGLVALVGADLILLVESPDYTTTPVGPSYRRPDDAARIAEANAILRAVGEERGIAVVSIAPIGDLVPADPTLVAPDGLHPSGKQYAGWVELIAPVVRGLLAPPEGSPAP
jgi:hypothetical protein